MADADNDIIQATSQWLDLPVVEDRDRNDHYQSYINELREEARRTPWARNISVPDHLDPVGQVREIGTNEALLQRARSLGRPFGAEEQASRGLRPFAPVGTRYRQDQGPLTDLVRGAGLRSGPGELLSALGQTDASTELVQKDKTRELIAFAVAAAAATAATGGAAGAALTPYLGATGGAVAGGAASGLAGAAAHGAYSQDINWQDLLIGALAGGAGGGVGAATSGLSPAAQAGARGLTAAGVKATGDAIRGRPFDPYGTLGAGATASIGPLIGQMQLPTWAREAIQRLAVQGIQQSTTKLRKDNS